MKRCMISMNSTQEKALTPEYSKTQNVVKVDSGHVQLVIKMSFSSSHLLTTLSAASRRGQVLRLLDLGNNTKAGVALVPNSIDALEENITKNVELHVSSGLDSTVPVLLIGRGKGQVFLLNHELLATNIDLELGEVVDLGTEWEDVALVLFVVCGTWNLVVQGLADLVRHQGKGGTGVSNGKVSTLLGGLAVDGDALRGELPETLRVVDLGPVYILALDEVLIDEAKRVERLLALVTVTVEGRGEQLRVLGNIVLGNHVLDWGGGGFRRALVVGDSVDLAKGQAKKSVAGSLGKLGRHLLG